MYDLNKRYIFTHPLKTGGTSVEDLLGFLQLREKYPAVHRFKHASLNEHIVELENKGTDTSDFFKFSIIRNPWARMVSIYNHYKYKEYEHFKQTNPQGVLPGYIEDALQLDFKSYVFKYTKHSLNSEKITLPYFFADGVYLIDHTIRLEHIKEDILAVADRLQLDLDADVPHRNNADLYAPRQNYREYYDQAARERVASLFKWDISTFDYTF